MASVRDLSGNTPESDSDTSGAGKYSLQAVVFKGAQHSLTLGAAAVNTGILSRACRSVRIAPEGDCRWEVGDGAVATATSPLLVDNAVEIVPIVEQNATVSVIQNASETDLVSVVEDR